MHKNDIDARLSTLTFPEFVWIWNYTQGLSTPHIHIRMSRWIFESWRQGNQNLLLLAFRNSGKSTITALFCAWLLYRESHTTILILAADVSLAAKMTRNVRKVIERHPFTRHLKPHRPEQWAADQFIIHRETGMRDPSTISRGVTSNITGLRADIIICDDVEVPNTCNTIRKRQLLRERLCELEFICNPNGLKFFIGTPHSYDSIYVGEYESGQEESHFLAGYSRLEIPILDNHGRSQWPERFSIEKIREIEERSGANKFKSQMLLSPTDYLESRLDVSLLRDYNENLLYQEGNGYGHLTLGNRRLLSVSCWWDPAFGSSSNGHASVVACVFTDEEGDYWIHSVRYLEIDPTACPDEDEATQMCRQVADFVTKFYIPAVTIEINGIGRFLPSLLRRELATQAVDCAVIEHSSRKAKDLRILEAFEAILAAGRLHLHRDIRGTRFISEMREWRPGVSSDDDGLDAVAGCLLSEPIRLPRVSAPARVGANRARQWQPIQPVTAAALDFQP